MKNYLFFSFYFLLNSFIYVSAQGNNIKNLDTDLKILKNELIKYTEGENKLKKSVYSDHLEGIKHFITMGYNKENFILENDYEVFINEIFSQLKSKNSLPNNENDKVYIVKSSIPNALSLGFNYYVINSALLEFVDNDYQLSAVVAHELAHNILQHTRQSLDDKVAFLKEIKKEYKSIKGREYIKLIKSQDEVLQMKYDLANKSRKQEIAADSLGYVLYTNLGYPKEEYYNFLKKFYDLEKKEKTLLNDSVYDNFFNLPNLKFKKEWIVLKKEDAFSGLKFTEHVDKDSVMTHPNTIDRIKWIEKNFKLNDSVFKVNKPSNKLIALKDKISKSFYETLYHNDNYAEALYILLKDENDSKDQKIVNKNLSIIFNKLFDARKDHNFNKYIPLADANAEDLDYQKLLNFLWSLDTEELKLIKDYYTEKNKATS